LRYALPVKRGEREIKGFPQLLHPRKQQVKKARGIASKNSREFEALMGKERKKEEKSSFSASTVRRSSQRKKRKAAEEARPARKSFFSSTI